jgi:hypothetical protein
LRRCTVTGSVTDRSPWQRLPSHATPSLHSRPSRPGGSAHHFDGTNRAPSPESDGRVVGT